MSLKILSQNNNTEFKVNITPSEESERGTLRLFEDILNSGLSLRVKVTGRSMSPFLRGGEILTIRKVPLSSLQTGDLIFFKNHLGSRLLHRIIKKKRDNNGMFAFQTKGDALRVCDESVRHDEILGKVFKIEKINSVICSKHINMESTSWQTINYLIATTCLFESRLFSILRAFKNLLRKS